MERRDLYEALAALGTIPFKDTVFRHVSIEFDCHSGEGASNRGGRWNPPDSFPTLYTALSLQTTAAEFLRLATRLNLSPDLLLPRKICHLTASLTSIADLTSAKALETVGLRPADVVSDQWSKCRQVGEAVCKFGLEGLLAPSASGTGEVLVVFPLNLSVTSEVTPIRTTTWTALADLGSGRGRRGPLRA